jgi:hypothetical protein
MASSTPRRKPTNPELARGRFRAGPGPAWRCAARSAGQRLYRRRPGISSRPPSGLTRPLDVIVLNLRQCIGYPQGYFGSCPQAWPGQAGSGAGALGEHGEASGSAAYAMHGCWTRARGQGRQPAWPARPQDLGRCHATRPVRSAFRAGRWRGARPAGRGCGRAAGRPVAGRATARRAGAAGARPNLEDRTTYQHWDTPA